MVLLKKEHTTLVSGSIGVIQLVLLVLATNTPVTTIFGMIPIAMMFGNGLGVPGLYLFITIVWLLYAVGYSNMTRYVRNTGSAYAFNAQGLGRPVGISASYLTLFNIDSLYFACLGLFGYSMDLFLSQHLNIHLTWWGCSLIAWVIIAILGYLELEIGVKVLTTLLTFEIIIFALLAVIALFNPSPEGYTMAPLNPQVIFSGAIGMAIMFTFGSFTGFESTAVYSEEVKDPLRSVPRATYWAVAVIGGFLFLISFSLVQGWGAQGIVNKLNESFAQGGDPTSLITDLSHRLLGGWSGVTLQFLLICSVFSSCLACHNLHSRYLFACGRSKTLPAVFSKIHPRYGTPYVGSIFSSFLILVDVLIAAVLGMDPYLQVWGWFGGLGSMGSLLMYSITSIAIISYFVRTKKDTRLWHTKIAPGLATIALIGATIYTYKNFDVLLGPGQTTLMILIIITYLLLAAAGIIVGLWIRKTNPEAYCKIGASVSVSDQLVNLSDQEANGDVEQFNS